MGKWNPANRALCPSHRRYIIEKRLRRAVAKAAAMGERSHAETAALAAEEAGLAAAGMAQTVQKMIVRGECSPEQLDLLKSQRAAAHTAAAQSLEAAERAKPTHSSVPLAEGAAATSSSGGLRQAPAAVRKRRPAPLECRL